ARRRCSCSPRSLFSESESAESAESAESEEEQSAGDKARLLRTLSRETADLQEALPDKGLLALPFMRRGLEKRRERNRQEIERLRRHGESEEDSEGADEALAAGRKPSGDEDASDLESTLDETEAREARDAVAEAEVERRPTQTGRRKRAVDLDPKAVEAAEQELEGKFQFFELNEADGSETQASPKDAGKAGAGEQRAFASSAAARAFFQAELEKEEKRREEAATKRSREAHATAWAQAERSGGSERERQRELERSAEAANPWLRPQKKRKVSTAGTQVEETAQQLQKLLNDEESSASEAEGARPASNLRGKTEREAQRELIQQAFVCDEDAEEEFIQEQEEENKKEE
ncbi:Utp14, partial [Toxoplasma gondii MAS]